MTKKKEMRRVDTIDGDDPWLAYWRWWYSDRPEARLELKLKLQASVAEGSGKMGSVTGRSPAS